MKLNLSEKNRSYKIKSMSLPNETRRRLEALGMMPGTNLAVLNTKSHGTLIIKVRGTRFAIGKGITELIDVSEINTKEGVKNG